VNSKPYIDLHVHLDGAITVDIAKELAEMQGIDLLAENDEELAKFLSVPEDCENLDHFLECFDIPIMLLQTPEAIERAVYRVQENLKAQGIIYTELRFAPCFFTQNGLSQEEVVEAALKGLEQSDLRTNLILCCMRSSELHESNMETVEVAKKYLVKNNGIVALDLAGGEASNPTCNFAKEFELAANYSIPFTIHSGEAGGSQNVRDAIKFGAKRIGHGIRISDDEELLQEIVEKRIVLEMCPTSNRQTKAVADMKDYPLRNFMNRNIKVTINTDDPSVCNTDIKTEYDYIQNNFGITEEDKYRLMLNAAQSAFTNDLTKADLIKQVCIGWKTE